jgi:RNA polymerase sigma factor (sigma-70 family)
MLCETNAAPIEAALARFQAGEEQAFHELVEIAYAWLGQRLIALLRSYPAVRLPSDEILHDRVLGRLRTALLTQAPQTCAEVTRLAGTSIRWSLRDIVRAQRQRPDGVPVPAEIDEEGDSVADLIDQGERTRFHQAAAELAEPLRRVFCLRYYAGFSEEEVADELGVSERSIRNYWRLAIDALSMTLTGQPFAGELPRLRRQGPAEGSPLCGCPRSQGSAPEEGKGA